VRRFVKWVGGISATALIVTGVVLIVLNRLIVQHWLAIHTGTEFAGPDKFYNAWSGWVSDIGEVVLIGGLVQLVRQRNCHHKGCWRFSHHTTAKGYKLCKIHVALPEDELDLHEIHEDHQ
jgi:hypothetical protein